MKNRLLALLSLIVLFLASCSGGKASTEINLGALKGPTAMGMVNLLDEIDNNSLNEKYSYELFGAIDEASTKLAKGELDITAIPCNVAANLYNNKVGIKVIAVNTLGVLYIVDSTGTVKSIEDLVDKTVYSTGQGSTPEVALNYILEMNNIKDKVNVEYKAEATELAALLSSEGGKIALLPEPFVQSVLAQNDSAKVVLSLTEEWDKVQPNFPIVTGVVVARSEFLASNEKIVKNFLADYKKSIDFTKNNIDEAADLIEKYGIVAKAAIAKKSLPNCNIVYLDGDEMKTAIEGYLSVFMKETPDANFYFVK